VELKNSLCERLGIGVPIVQAPIGSATTPELAAAVSNAGALGMLALTWLTRPEASQRVQRTRDLTDRPFGVNVSLDFPIDAQLDDALEAGVTVVSSFWGDPASIVSQVRSAGATHLHTVGSPQEARQAVDVGVDVVVAQGFEAGGHVWGSVATLPLIPAVVDAVAPTPVIAAGGIGDGRGIAAVLMLGAQAAWLGTRFAAAAEAGTHDDYRTLLIDAEPTDTVYTACFDGGWPNAPHRVLKNSTLTRWEAAGRPPAPNRPGEGDEVARTADGCVLRRYDDMMPLRQLHGNVQDLALYAGQSVGLVQDVMPAGDVVNTLIAQAQQALKQASSLTRQQSHS
jgi:NAD(P)H-dependent flavin oxidoreductase YrpB (nitropropane dioxygenase family)